MFKRRKLRNIMIENNKEKMKKLFSKEIKDASNYKLIYAYHEIFNSKINDYTYNNYILGYKDYDTLIIMEVDKEIKNIYSIRKITKNDLKKTSYNPNYDFYKIYLDTKDKKKECIRFSILYKNYIDIDILPLMEQELEIDDFNDFFIEFRSKPYHFKKK